MRLVASSDVYRWWGQTTAVITDSRDSCSPLPLGVTEQAPPVGPITSKRGIAIKYKLLLCPLPWELMHPAAAISKCSGHLVDLPRAHYHFPGPATRSSLCHPPVEPCCCWEPNHQALTAGPIHCHLLPENTLSILGIRACSHWKKRQQIFKLPHPK